MYSTLGYDLKENIKKFSDDYNQEFNSKKSLIYRNL
jgi:hypothetical protein